MSKTTIERKPTSNRNLRPNNPKQRRRAINVPRHDLQNLRGGIESRLVGLAVRGVTRRRADRDAEDAETATRGSRFFKVLREGRGQRVAHADLVADTSGDDELFGLDECFQVLGRVGAELELAGVEVPVKRRMGWLAIC